MYRSASVAYSCGHVALRLRYVLVVLCLHSGILGRAAAVVNSALTQCFAYRPRCLVRQHTRLGQHDVQLAGAPWKQQAPHSTRRMQRRAQLKFQNQRDAPQFGFLTGEMNLDFSGAGPHACAFPKARQLHHAHVCLSAPHARQRGSPSPAAHHVA